MTVTQLLTLSACVPQLMVLAPTVFVASGRAGASEGGRRSALRVATLLSMSIALTALAVAAGA